MSNGKAVLKQIKTSMQDEFKKNDIIAEVTFASATLFSIFCEDAADFTKAKALMAAANQDFNSEDSDPEIGFFAYYNL